MLFEFRRSLRAITLPLLLLTGLVLSDPASAGTAKNAPDGETSLSASQDDKIRFQWVGDGRDDDLVIDQILTRKRGKTTQIAFRFRNDSSDKVSLQYRIAWEDEDGFSVGEDTVWMDVWIPAGGSEKVTTRSKDRAAVRAVISLRPN